MVSSVLVWMNEKGAQKPIYFTSRVLYDTEIGNSKLEKIIYLLIISTYFRPYFQAHTIVVLTDQPLETILQ